MARNAETITATTDLGEQRIVLHLSLSIYERLQCDQCKGYMSDESAYLVYEKEESTCYHLECLI
jgi:hypothetical protein